MFKQYFIDSFYFLGTLLIRGVTLIAALIIVVIIALMLKSLYTELRKK